MVNVKAPLMVRSWFPSIKAFVLFTVRLVMEGFVVKIPFGMVKALPPKLPVVPKIRLLELLKVRVPVAVLSGVFPFWKVMFLPLASKTPLVSAAVPFMVMSWLARVRLFVLLIVRLLKEGPAGAVPVKTSLGNVNADPPKFPAVPNTKLLVVVKARIPVVLAIGVFPV